MNMPWWVTPLLLLTVLFVWIGLEIAINVAEELTRRREIRKNGFPEIEEGITREETYEVIRDIAHSGGPIAIGTGRKYPEGECWVCISTRGRKMVTGEGDTWTDAVLDLIDNIHEREQNELSD